MQARIIALAVSGALLVAGAAIAQQDKYALSIGKLSFADFKGYEDWKVVSVSQQDDHMKMILANDVMIAAYRDGLPADGKSFPEGSKVVKIVYSMKKDAKAPDPTTVPDMLKAVAVIEKDSKRFPDTHGWASGVFQYDGATKSFAAQGKEPTCGYACHSKVASQDYIFTAMPPR